MIKGKSLIDLATEIERQTDAARDFVVPAAQLTLTDDARLVTPTGAAETAALELTDDAHGQLATRLDIPRGYYDRMRREAPELLATNANRWLHDGESNRLMVRTLDGRARALLSDRYRRIDNYQILSAALPALRDAGVELKSCDVTDRNLFLQAVFPRVEGEVKVGDVVQAGFVLRNSETGFGALDVSPMIYRLVCTNGMIRGSDAGMGRLRKTHLGRKVTGDENFAIYAEDTLEADDRALMLKIRDSIAALSNPALFLDLVNKMRTAATETDKVQRPVAAVEELGKTFGLSKLEREATLTALIRDGDYSLYGAMNAVTNIANNAASYDRAIELEQIGGRVLDLSPREWSKIALADAA